MSLRQLAQKDLKYILENDAGTVWNIVITNPAGVTRTIKGSPNDISQVVDPETGQIVSGRSASIAVAIATLFEAGFDSLPVGISDSYSKPWLIQFDDINSNSHTFKVIQTNPDRTLGLITCHLEVYKV